MANENFESANAHQHAKQGHLMESAHGHLANSPSASGAPLAQMNPREWIADLGKRVVVPTPDPVSADGEPVHPSVLHFPEAWNGYSYWMGFTPYAGGKDAYEDPCIVVSNDGDTWITPEGLTNPLDNAPGGQQYNSDTNLVYHDGLLHLFWRYFDNTATGREESLWVRTSANGVTWSPKIKVYESDKLVRRLVSPAFHFEDSKWHMWAIDIRPRISRMVRLTAPALAGPWSAPEVCSVYTRPGKICWHLSVRKFGSQYVALLNDTNEGGAGARSGDLILMTSENGIDWSVGMESVVPRRGPHHTDLYAASLVESADGYDLWYSARITDNPSIWSILRTKLIRREPGTNINTGASAPSAPYKIAAGIESLGTVEGNGGSSAVTVAFPSGLFTQLPIITLSSGNGRINPGTSGVTMDGFTLKGFNWTPGNAVNPTISWIAIQMDA